MPFPIRGPLEPSLYLQPFSRYSLLFESTHVNIAVVSTRTFIFYKHNRHEHTNEQTNKHDTSQYLLAEVITRIEVTSVQYLMHRSQVQ